MFHARADYNRIQDPAGLIPEDEPVFLLRGQDETTAATVRFWASKQKPGSRGQRLAIQHAALIDNWPVKKTADVPE